MGARFTPSLNTHSVQGGISQTLTGWESSQRAESGESTFTPSCKLVKSFLNQGLGLSEGAAQALLCFEDVHLTSFCLPQGRNLLSTGITASTWVFAAYWCAAELEHTEEVHYLSKARAKET